MLFRLWQCVLSAILVDNNTFHSASPKAALLYWPRLNEMFHSGVDWFVPLSVSMVGSQPKCLEIFLEKRI